MGKTALSAVLANDPEVRAHFQDGIVWAGLGPEPNMSGHVLRWGAMLGISPDEVGDNKDIDAWVSALHLTAGSRTMLFILDDVWKAEDALRFTIGGPTCAHLITTRFSSIATQIAADGAAEVEELTDEEGMTLVRTLAPQVVEQEPQQVHELVKDVGGLPLALTLIGNYLRIQSYKSHPRRLLTALQLLRDDPGTRLDLQEARSPARHHSSQPGATLISLRSIIAVTDQQLAEHVRHALYALAVFPAKPNSFAEKAALAVADCSAEVLDTLTDTGLLQINSAHRYMLHPTIADYASVQLEYSGDFDQAYQRLITSFTTLVETHNTDDPLLEREYTNILAALEAAFHLDGATELPRLACAFTPFLLSRGLAILAEHHLQRAYHTAFFLEDEVSQRRVLMTLEPLCQQQGKRVRDILEQDLVEPSFNEV